MRSLLLSVLALLLAGCASVPRCDGTAISYEETSKVKVSDWYESESRVVWTCVSALDSAEE